MFPLDLSISRSIPSHYIYRDITLFDLCFMFPSFNISIHCIYTYYIYFSTNSTRIKVSRFLNYYWHWNVTICYIWYSWLPITHLCLAQQWGKIYMKWLLNLISCSIMLQLLAAFWLRSICFSVSIESNELISYIFLYQT